MKLHLELYILGCKVTSRELDISGDETIGWLLGEASNQFRISSARLRMVTPIANRQNIYSARYNKKDLATINNLTKPIQDKFPDNATILLVDNYPVISSTANHKTSQEKWLLAKLEHQRIQNLKQLAAEPAITRRAAVGALNRLGLFSEKISMHISSYLNPEEGQQFAKICKAARDLADNGKAASTSYKRK